MSPALSVIIPAYNEAANMSAIWQAIAVLTEQNTELEIILVNNGSTDNTGIVLQNLQEKEPNTALTICTVPKNKGYGYGIKAGLTMATAPLFCWTHADLQTDLADTLTALALYNTYNSETIVIKGNRKNRNWLDAFFTWGMQVYTNVKLSTSLHDINAQPKLFHSKFWLTIAANAPDDFSIDLYLLYQAKKSGTIKTIDVVYKTRQFGEAKGGGSLRGKWKLIKRTFAYINQMAKTI